MELVLATTNMHKIREIREMLKPLKHFDVLSLLNFPDYVPPPETGVTFEENAVIKAVHAGAALKRWVLADDSGLVVPALKGAPGVHSRRYAGDDATDTENRQKLMREMASITDDADRHAYYECCLALANADGIQKITRGTCEGTILTEERGRNGFAYDSLFVKYDYDKTFAEISDDAKNRVSHRSKAFEKLIIFLENLRDKSKQCETVR